LIEIAGMRFGVKILSLILEYVVNDNEVNPLRHYKRGDEWLTIDFQICWT
jgi:hypothetical protein